MSNIWILGSNGMLGHDYTSIFQEMGLHSINFSRNHYFVTERNTYQDFALDANNLHTSFSKVLDNFGPPRFILNAIGIVKPRISEEVNSISNAYLINSIFPHKLDRFASDIGAQVLQIGTDCVFSGEKGMYTENDVHDAKDHYGLSKSIGECQSNNTKIIRSSIIGIELNNKYSLVSWVQNQSINSQINGYVNHMWNGVTTKVFAKILVGLVIKKVDISNLQHLIPANQLNKYELVNIIADKLGRKDLKIKSVTAEQSVNRTLATVNSEMNDLLWKSAGYTKVPTVEELVQASLW